VPTVADRHAGFARQLESDLEEYPDERGEILLEAGDAWHRAGHSQRAIALLTEAVALGGEDGGNARVALADVLFDIGRDEEARAQLGALRSDAALAQRSAVAVDLAQILEQPGTPSRTVPAQCAGQISPVPRSMVQVRSRSGA
jgi:thioredoxin-like negative regulator of GroEL